MTTRKDLPEAATREPRIRSTEEEAERAARRDEESEHVRTAKEARQLSNADNPLRVPGELSSQPEEEAEEARRAAPDPDDESEP